MSTELPSIESLNEQQDALMRKMMLRENQLLQESLDTLDRWIDPMDAYRGEDGELWNLVGRIGAGATGAAGANQPATDRAGFATQQELDRAREVCRVLAEVSEFAQNIIENRISYIVGYGHTYTVVSKKGVEADETSLAPVQEWLDQWLEQTNWATRQQEIVRRNDRDGETFLRFFPQADGFMQVRFVEPWQVVPPSGGVQDLFGVRTKPDDVENVLGYWIDGKLVDASEVQHRKLNVDLNVRRGVPTLWSIRTLLRRADGIIGKIATKIDIQAAFALIRKHSNATATQAGAIRAGAATNRVQDPRTGRVDNYQLMRGGMIIDAPAGSEYEFPRMVGGQVADAVEGLQAVLRAIAARVQMPEFMVTADASNANYSSTMVAEGPATKAFERLQQDQIRNDLKVIDLAMQFAAAENKLPANILEAIEVQASPPQIAVRDRLQETGVREKLHKARILSKQTWTQEEGYDFEQEQKNLEEAPPEPAPGFDEFGNPKQPKALEDDGNPKRPNARPVDEATRMAAVRRIWEGYP